MLSNVIKKFRTGKRDGVYYVTRITDAGVDSTGYALDPSTEQVRIEASVQPAGRQYLQVLPDGLRIEDTQIIFTATLLHASTPSQRADVVDVDGVPYTVVSVLGPYQLGRSFSYEVIAAKQSVGGSS